MANVVHSFVSSPNELCPCGPDSPNNLITPPTSMVDYKGQASELAVFQHLRYRALSGNLIAYADYFGSDIKAAEIGIRAQRCAKRIVNGECRNYAAKSTENGQELYIRNSARDPEVNKIRDIVTVKVLRSYL